MLAGGWASLMIVYLLGEVLRIFAGHVEPGRLGRRHAPDWMWTLIAVIMIVPIAMIMTSLLVPAEPLRWITIAVSIALVVFNIAGPPYRGFFDNTLIVLSFSMNVLVVWIAWAWNTSPWPQSPSSVLPLRPHVGLSPRRAVPLRDPIRDAGRPRDEGIGFRGQTPWRGSSWSSVRWAWAAMSVISVRKRRTAASSGGLYWPSA